MRPWSWKDAEIGLTLGILALCLGLALLAWALAERIMPEVL